MSIHASMPQTVSGTGVRRGEETSHGTDSPMVSLARVRLHLPNQRGNTGNEKADEEAKTVARGRLTVKTSHVHCRERSQPVRPPQYRHRRNDSTEKTPGVS